VRYLHYFSKNIIFLLMWARIRLSVERYLNKFDPLSTVTPRGVFCVNKGETDPKRVILVTPRGVFCVNKGETDPKRVSLKQKKTRSLTNRQGNKYTKKKKPCRSVVF